MRGVIHGPDAPADVSDAAAFAALKAQLPADAPAVCSPARRTRETALALGLDPLEQGVLCANRILGRGPGGGMTISPPSSARPIAISGNRRRIAARPAAKVLSIRSPASEAGSLACRPADVVLVVHSGTIRAVLAIALDLAPDAALRFVIDPLSLTRIDRLDNGWRIVAVNQR